MGLTPAPMSDRLQLAQSRVQCLGSQRDAFIVAQTAKMMSVAGRNPSHAGNNPQGCRSIDCWKVPRQDIQKTHLVLRRLPSTTSRKHFLLGPKPCARAGKLTCTKLFTALSSKFKGGVVEELPVDVKMRRKPVANPSTLTAGISQWLESKEGRE